MKINSYEPILIEKSIPNPRSTFFVMERLTDLGGGKSLFVKDATAEEIQYMTNAVNTAHVEVISSPIPLLFFMGAVFIVVVVKYVHNFFARKPDAQISI